MLNHIVIMDRLDSGQSGYTPSGYAPASSGYPAQPDPESEFSELETDEG